MSADAFNKNNAYLLVDVILIQLANLGKSSVEFARVFSCIELTKSLELLAEEPWMASMTDATQDQPQSPHFEIEQVARSRADDRHSDVRNVLGRKRKSRG